MQTFQYFPKDQQRQIIEATQNSLFSAGPNIEIHNETLQETVKLSGLSLSNAWIQSFQDLQFVLTILRQSLQLNLNNQDAISIGNMIDKSLTIFQCWILGDLANANSFQQIHAHLVVNQPFVLQENLKLLDWVVRQFLDSCQPLLTLSYPQITLEPVLDSSLQVQIEPATSGYPNVTNNTVITLYSHLIKRLLTIISLMIKHPILPHYWSKETWSCLIHVLASSTLYQMPEFDQIHAQLFGLLLIVIFQSNIGQLDNPLLQQFPSFDTMTDSPSLDSKQLWTELELLFPKVWNKSSHLVQFNNALLPLTNHLVHLLYSESSSLVIIDPISSKPITMEVGGERASPTFQQITSPKPIYTTPNPLVKTSSSKDTLSKNYLEPGSHLANKSRLLLVTTLWWKLVNLVHIENLEPHAFIMTMNTLGNLTDILHHKTVSSNTMLDIISKWTFNSTTFKLGNWDYEQGRSLALANLFKTFAYAQPPISSTYITSFQSILSTLLEKGDAGVMSQIVENLRVLFAGVKGYGWTHMWNPLIQLIPHLVHGLYRCVPINQLPHDGVNKMSVYALLTLLFSVPSNNPVWNLPNNLLSRNILTALEGQPNTKSYITYLLLSSLLLEKEPAHQSFLLRCLCEISQIEPALKPLVIKATLEKVLSSVLGQAGWSEEVVLTAFDCLIQTPTPSVADDVLSNIIKYLDTILGRSQSVEPGNLSHLGSLVPFKNLAPKAYDVLTHWISIGPISPILLSSLASTLSRGIGLLDDGEFGRVLHFLDAKTCPGPLSSAVGAQGTSLVQNTGRIRSASTPMSPVREVRANTPDVEDVLSSTPPGPGILPPTPSSSTLDKLQKVADGFVQGLTDATGVVVAAPMSLGKALRKTTGTMKRGQSGVQILANSVQEGAVVTGSGVNPVGKPLETTPMGIPSFAIQQVALMIKISAEVGLSRLLMQESVYGMQRLSTLYTDSLEDTKFYSVDSRCIVSLKQSSEGVVMVMRDATSRYSWMAKVSGPELPEKSRRRMVTISEGSPPKNDLMELPPIPPIASPPTQIVPEKSVRPKSQPYLPEADIVHVDAFNESSLPPVDALFSSTLTKSQVESIIQALNHHTPKAQEVEMVKSLPPIPTGTPDYIRSFTTQLGEWSLENYAKNRWIPLQPSETLIKDLARLDDFVYERECVGVGVLYCPNLVTKKGWEGLETFITNKHLNTEFWNFLTEVAIPVDIKSHVGWMGNVPFGTQDSLLYWSDEWYQVVMHLPQLIKPVKPSVTAVGPIEPDFPVRESSLNESTNQNLLHTFKTMISDDLVWILWVEDGVEAMISSLYSVQGPTIFILITPLDPTDPLGLFSVKTLFVNPLYQGGNLTKSLALATAPTRNLVVEGTVDPTTIPVPQIPFGPLLSTSLVPRNQLATLIRLTVEQAHSHVSLQFRQGNCGIFGTSKPVKRPYFQRRQEIEEITKKHRIVYTSTGSYFASAFAQ